jgi:hypothetical protein
VSQRLVEVRYVELWQVHSAYAMKVTGPEAEAVRGLLAAIEGKVLAPESCGIVVRQ